MTPRWLILHHLGEKPKGATPETLDLITIDVVRKWHTDPKPTGRGWMDVGYHKMIYRSGKVVQGRSDAVIGAHAFGANQYSLGILVAGWFDEDEPTEEQKRALVWVCAVLCRRYSIPPSHIIGHADVPRVFGVKEGASACPGKNLLKFIPTLQKEVAEALEH